MGVNGGAADLFHIIQRRAKADGLDDRRRPGLESLWRNAVSHIIARHRLDHFAAAGEGRQALQPFLLAVKRANAGRAIKACGR